MNILKKILASVLLFSMVLSFASCKKDNEKDVEDKDKNIKIEEGTITWWTLPVFSGIDGETESFEESLIAGFKSIYPKITIEHKVLSEETYLNDLKTAAADGTLPDIYFGFPEDIQEFAKDGKMVDISDILMSDSKETDQSGLENSDDKSEESGEGSQQQNETTNNASGVNIPENILMSSTIDEGKTRTFYPISASAYVMAFNKEIVEQAGALDLLPTDGSRNWTMEQYKTFLAKLNEGLADQKNIDSGILYYGSSIGAIGTKSLVSNAGGTLFEKDGQLTINSPEGVAGLSAVKGLIDENLLVNGMNLQSSTNYEAFINGTVAHTILYSMTNELNNKQNKKDNFTTIFMPYPSTGEAMLDYTLLGAGIFNSEDQNKVESAKLFVDFIANDPGYRSSVAGRTGGYSVNKDYNDFLEGEYAFFAQSLDMHAPYEQKQFDNASVDLHWINCLNQVFFKDADPTEKLNEFAQAASSSDGEQEPIDGEQDLSEQETDSSSEAKE